MNNERRKRLADIVTQLQALPPIDEIKSDLEGIRDDEQEAYDNLPESLQNGERGEQMQAAISAMEEVIDALDGFSTDELVGHIETASE